MDRREEDITGVKSFSKGQWTCFGGTIVVLTNTLTHIELNTSINEVPYLNYTSVKNGITVFKIQSVCCQG